MKYILTLLISIILLSCEKTELPQSYIGMWGGHDNAVITQHYALNNTTTDTFNLYISFYIAGNELLAKTSDSEHSGGFDIVKNIPTTINGDSVSFNSRIVTARSCGFNERVETHYTCYIEGSELIVIGEYYSFGVDSCLISYGKIHAVCNHY